MVRLLCEEGSDKDAVDTHGRTALHCAVTQGWDEVVKYLLEQRVDKDVLDQQGRSCLHEAVLSPRTFGVVRCLVHAGVDKHRADAEGRTPLYEAACHGHKQVVAYLIQHGADVDASDSHGKTSLYIACQMGSLAVCRILLDAGANVEMADRDGWSPMHVASWYGHLPVVRLLCQVSLRDVCDQQGQTPLFLACCSGHSEVVRCLIQTGCDKNHRDHLGRSCLLEAARLRCGAVVQALCQAKAHTDQKDPQGRTALHIAVWSGSLHIVDLLLHCSDVNGADLYGRTPLFLSSFLGHLPMTRLLVEAGANKQKTDPTGRSPLHTATVGGHFADRKSVV